MEERLLNQRYKRRTTVVAALLAISALSFGGILLFQLVQLRVSWVDYSYESAQRSELIVRIHRSVGYGGFIHDFKNYLLRPDKQHSERLQFDINETESALNAYAKLVVSPQERVALDTIKATFAVYTSHISTIEQNTSQKMSIGDLDRRIRVDDRPAVSALMILQGEYEQFAYNQRSSVQERINFIINLLLVGLISLPLIGAWAYRHIGLLERLVHHVSEKRQIQRRLEQTEAEASRAKKTGERYKYLAYRCTLTEIPNRQAFNEAVARAFTEARVQDEKFTILYVDVDDFKQVNDRFGHEVGDQVLKEIAGRLDRVLREGDVVARIGGDEFAILVFGRELMSANDQLAERILGTLREPFEHILPGLMVSCSVGGAIGPDHGDDVDSLLKVADSKMYEVKHGGKNGVMIG